MEVDSLIIAGAMSLIAAFLHLSVIMGGANWYRFFGAGESFSLLVEEGSWKPLLITFSIAIVLTVWAFYAWSAAGLIPLMPFSAFVLPIITTIYLARGLVGMIAPFVSTHSLIQQNTKRFWFWSSLICLIVGLFHFIGLITVWDTL